MSSIEVIDTQVHVWDVESPEFPWQSQEPKRREHAAADPITDVRMIGMMDAAGVEAAILTSPGLYGTDFRYACAAAERFPDRFGVVGRLEPGMPDLHERVASLRDHPAGVGIRVVVNPDSDVLETSECRAIFAAAAAIDLPVFVWVMVGRLYALSGIVESFPDLRLVVDHLGMRDIGGRDPLDRLHELLALARLPRLAVKCSGTMALSKQAFPFDDLWPHLHRILDAFGPERVMWGSDITQHMRRGTYAESVDFLRRSSELSESEKRLVLGGAVRAFLGWPRDVPRRSGSPAIPGPLEGPPPAPIGGTR